MWWTLNEQMKLEKKCVAPNTQQTICKSMITRYFNSINKLDLDQWHWLNYHCLGIEKLIDRAYVIKAEINSLNNLILATVWSIDLGVVIFLIFDWYFITCNGIVFFLISADFVAIDDYFSVVDIPKEHF